mmetsp:Transcript_42067/g.89593  ORF Transcript_42067/g.89593 Transcript_42067/m.89593 type:complete len:295 (-) Transcript_42067:47-931(-)
MATNVEHHAARLRVQDFEKLVQLLAAVTALGCQDVPCEALGVHTGGYRFGVLQLSLDDRDNFYRRIRSAVHTDAAVGLDVVHPHLALGLQDWTALSHSEQGLSVLPVGADLIHGEDWDAVLLTEALSILDGAAGAILLHEFRYDPDRGEVGDLAQVVDRLAQTPSLQGAALACAEGEGVPWDREGGGRVRRVAQSLQRGSAVLRAGACGHAWQEVYGQVRALARTAPARQRVETKALEAPHVQDGDHDPGGVPDQISHPPDVGLLRGQCQATFRFAIPIIHHDDVVPSLKGSQR